MTRTEHTRAAPDDGAVIDESLRDPERFGLLFDRHAPHIHRYLARRLGRQVADDLVAEVFLAAFRRRHRYRTDQPDARPWLYGISTRLVGQHRREEAREYRLRRAIPPDGAEPGHEDRVAADVTAQGWRGPLATALAGLPARDRDVLLLIAWEALSYEEVATALAIPVGTVRSRLHRARTTIRTALGTSPYAATSKETTRG
jgi:RNA polymerase sigma factor (sigma-70 family)